MKRRTIIAPEATKTKKAEMIQEVEDYSDIRGKVAAHKRALLSYDAKQQFLYPIERVTLDHTVIRNVKYPGADQDYPEDQHALFRFVSKYYPNAQGGPLYVDEPRNENEIYRAHERQAKMKARKLRHVVVDSDSTYEDLMMQLGEF